MGALCSKEIVDFDENKFLHRDGTIDYFSIRFSLLCCLEASAVGTLQYKHKRQQHGSVLHSDLSQSIAVGPLLENKYLPSIPILLQDAVAEMQRASHSSSLEDEDIKTSLLWADHVRILYKATNLRDQFLQQPTNSVYKTSSRLTNSLTNTLAEISHKEISELDVACLARVYSQTCWGGMLPRDLLFVSDEKKSGASDAKKNEAPKEPKFDQVRQLLSVAADGNWNMGDSADRERVSKAVEHLRSVAPEAVAVASYLAESIHHPVVALWACSSIFCPSPNFKRKKKSSEKVLLTTRHATCFLRLSSLHGNDPHVSVPVLADDTPIVKKCDEWTKISADFKVESSGKSSDHDGEPLDATKQRDLKELTATKDEAKEPMPKLETKSEVNAAKPKKDSKSEGNCFKKQPLCEEESKKPLAEKTEPNDRKETTRDVSDKERERSAAPTEAASLSRDPSAEKDPEHLPMKLPSEEEKFSSKSEEHVFVPTTKSVAMPPPPVESHEITDSLMRERITKLVKFYCPDEEGLADQLLRNKQGTYRELLDELIIKYGPECGERENERQKNKNLPRTSASFGINYDRLLEAKAHFAASVSHNNRAEDTAPSQEATMAGADSTGAEADISQGNEVVPVDFEEFRRDVAIAVMDCVSMIQSLQEHVDSLREALNKHQPRQPPKLDGDKSELRSVKEAAAELATGQGELVKEFSDLRKTVVSLQKELEEIELSTRRATDKATEAAAEAKEARLHVVVNDRGQLSQRKEIDALRMEIKSIQKSQYATEEVVKALRMEHQVLFKRFEKERDSHLGI